MFHGNATSNGIPTRVLISLILWGASYVVSPVLHQYSRLQSVLGNDLDSIPSEDFLVKIFRLAALISLAMLAKAMWDKKVYGSDEYDPDERFAQIEPKYKKSLT